MTRIVIRGYAAISRDGQPVTDPAILRTLAGLVYDDALFTACLAPPGVRFSAEEKVLADTLEPGGVISFSYHEGDPLLTATTEYQSPRVPTPIELAALVSYTMGQWSDGIGENLSQYSIHDECDFFCLWSKEVVEQCLKEYCPTFDIGSEYPTVEITGSPEVIQPWLRGCHYLVRYCPKHDDSETPEGLEQDTQCRLLRYIVGNPSRLAGFSPLWRTNTAVALAQQMDESRDFGAMPILADALQDAGCDNDDILNHCRGSGPHVRGCWVLDLVLGKK